MSELVRYSGSNEWSALYVDGELDRVGDHYLIDERIADIAGVHNHYSNDFMRGGQSREDVAKTLVEINQYSNKAYANHDKAMELRAQADKLTAEALALDPDWDGS